MATEELSRREFNALYMGGFDPSCKVCGATDPADIRRVFEDDQPTTCWGAFHDGPAGVSAEERAKRDGAVS